MSSFIPQQDNIAIGFSIAGLAFIPISTYYRRSYSRVLEAVQMCYLFAFTLVTTTSLFSNKLGYSWLSFMPSFLNFCTTGDFSCTYGYLLSPSICWVGASLLFLIIIKIAGRCKPSCKFQPFYNFFKGFFRWTFAPLIYFSALVLINKLQAGSKDNDLIASAVVLGYFATICFIEIIGYSCLGSTHRMTKVNQFFDHIRIASMVIMIVLSTKVNSNIKYILYVPIVCYDFFYLCTYNFVYKVFERVLFILSESTFITIYTLFLTNSSYISTYNLDLFGLAIIILIELLVIILRMYYKCTHKTEDDSQINPEQQQKPSSPRRLQPNSPLKRNNSFVADVQLGANISYEQLHNSSSSPRREVSLNTKQVSYNTKQKRRR